MTTGTVDRLWCEFLNGLLKSKPDKTPISQGAIEQYKACFYAGAWSVTHVLGTHSPAWDRDEWFRGLREDLEASIKVQVDELGPIMREVKQ